MTDDPRSAPNPTYTVTMGSQTVDVPIVEVAPPEGFSARDFLDTGRRPD